MKIIKPSVKCLWITPYPLEAIEQSGRTCYKSEDRIDSESSTKFVKMLLNRKHDAMIEHASMSYKVICDRGVSHEIVRHRLFSYAQESTRYCNYGKSGEISVIEPPGLDADSRRWWVESIVSAEENYIRMLDRVKPEIARSVLPNSLKTEIVITGNFREWRHFFALRTSRTAHPQMREIADMILDDATCRVKVVFDEYVQVK